MKVLSVLKKLISHRHPLRLKWHHAKAWFAAWCNGYPARKLTVIGITGTDGKTTTVSMVAHILEHAGVRCGALSTAFVKVDDETQWNATQKTSPSPFIIQSFLKRLTENNCTHAVLEVSSHGLVQGRLNDTWPKIAGITNTTPEHLDYHGTMEQYRRDKGILFRLLNGTGTKILNRDDDSYVPYLSIPTASTVTYSRTTYADLWLTNEQANAQSMRATLHSSGETDTTNLELSIPGDFNLENALCAIGCARAAGVELHTCLEALKTFKGVAGRFESIDEGQPFSVYVDFTVTPAAYEKTLTTLRQMIAPGKRILVLTGSCGDRMREKRPKIGRICSTLADVVVVTNEDPYTEDPECIIEEVWTGMNRSECDAYKIFDRREAMRFLLRKAQPGDAVIFCAKGSDTTMWTAKGQIPWNEREITRELLRHWNKL
ncbi:MAG: UDP-N-acetylmuramoyl-L-alanyl-D-glutamate--2,6-diaminopimelate ligase [Candidatus Peribacteraceae bacterium]|nr:UDP-N-acetylmuramoyl-L-alanyl-D-glutamate--2,6-diaminopimelate ligase [Candidatus Peribacteraceae bacterium]